MTGTLEELCAQFGVAGSYKDIAGELHVVPDTVKRALLAAMGADLSNASADTATPPTEDESVTHMPERPASRCYVPDFLKKERVWGIAVQLYQLTSDRSLGIGDFRDLREMAVLAAGAGADFLGVNPLHALFTADPARCSPFSPSNRRFLNPFYIAVDEAPGAQAEDVPAADREALQSSTLVDYAAVARVKLAALRAAHRRWRDDPAAERGAFDAFVAERGTALADHAAFEVLSHHFAAEGTGSGWKSWPDDHHGPRNDAVRRFLAEHMDDFSFHLYLQWVADRQLAAAAEAARDAGMRIGLYVDLAVGEAPDGSAGWSDPELVLPDVRVGAPPDYFNAAGQDWGLAPLSPRALSERDYQPLKAMLDDVLRQAGAIRIDHVMGLLRLFLIPADHTAAEGAYIRYAFDRALEVLAEVSAARGAVVIGEDLGTVPEGLRDVLADAEIHSYRILYFEHRGQHLAPPEKYPKKALACLSTHDMTPLAGWWQGHDIELRLNHELIEEEQAEKQWAERQQELAGLLADLATAGLAAPRRDILPELNDRLAAAVHGYMATAPSRLFAVRLEDLAGEIDPVNLPSTTEDYPNWRRRLPLPFAELMETPRATAILKSVATARPRP